MIHREYFFSVSFLTSTFAELPSTRRLISRDSTLDPPGSVPGCPDSAAGVQAARQVYLTQG